MHSVIQNDRKNKTKSTKQNVTLEKQTKKIKPNKSGKKREKIEKKKTRTKPVGLV